MSKLRELSFAELLLQKLVDEWESQAAIADTIDNLTDIVNDAKMHLREINRCEYESENGVRCQLKSVGASYGLCCCGEHKKIRDAYFNGSND